MRRLAWLLGVLAAAGVESVPLPTFGAGRDNFAIEQTYPSKQAYLRSRHRPFIDVDAQGLAFFDSGARLVGRVNLGRDRQGFERKPVLTRDGEVLPVVVRSTRGYETGQDIVEFLGLDAKERGEVTPPSLAYAVSPRGDFLIAAQRRTGFQFSYTSDFPVFDASGKQMAVIHSPIQPSNPRFVFSREGNYGAVLVYADSSDPKGSIIIFSAAGKLLGVYQGENWVPQAGRVDNPTPALVAPIAKIDEPSQTVISAGYDLSLRTRAVVAVNFKGKLLWRWFREGLPECPSTILFRSRAKDVVVADLCPNAVTLYAIDAATGILAHEASLPMDIGIPTNSMSRSSPGEDEILISFTANGSSGPKNAVLLFDRGLTLGWKDLTKAAVDEAHFTDGHVMLRRGDRVDIGRFE